MSVMKDDQKTFRFVLLMREISFPNLYIGFSFLHFHPGGRWLGLLCFPRIENCTHDRIMHQSKLVYLSAIQVHVVLSRSNNCKSHGWVVQLVLSYINLYFFTLDLILNKFILQNEVTEIRNALILIKIWCLYFTERGYLSQKALILIMIWCLYFKE